MEKCIFIGYPQGYKGWKFYNPGTKKVIISECADFDECFFINQKHSTPQLPPPHPNSLIEPSNSVIHLPILQHDTPDEPALSQQPDHGEMVLCFLICPLFALRCLHSLRKCILPPLHLHLLLLCLLLSPPFHLFLQSLLLFHLPLFTLGLSTPGVPERCGCLSCGLSLNATNK